MKLLITILLLLSNLSFAQIKGVVKDSISGKPIPYVNIWVENEKIGTTSEENGEFTINNSGKGINLIFSVIGFETKKIAVSDSKNVVLKPIVYQLDDVVISKLKMTKEIERGNFKKAFYLPEPQEIPWIFAKKIAIEKSNSELKYIKNITFFTQSQVEGAVFRVRIFSVNKENMPGEDVLMEDVIISSKKGKEKSIVDLLKYRIEIPKEGVIIGFESLFLDQNQYIQTSTKKGITIINFDPHILYQYINISITKKVTPIDLELGLSKHLVCIPKMEKKKE